MGRRDQYRHSSSKRVKVEICGPLPSFDEIQMRSFMSTGITIIELREFKEKKKRKKKKNMDELENYFLSHNFRQSGILEQTLAYSLVVTCIVL